MKIRIATYLLIIFCLSACGVSTEGGESQYVAKVGDKQLSREEVRNAIPVSVSSADSLLYADHYINRWVKDVLVYEQAVKNLGDEQEDINRLVREYRESLTKYRYMARMIKERVSADITEFDMQSYYDEHQEKFLLDRSLIKGLYVKVPADAPNLDDIKKWYKTDSQASLEKMEKYSLQNAISFDYFYDRWVEFDKVIDNIPIRVADSRSFLVGNKTVEVVDSTYCYLLNIAEYVPQGKIAPYEYAKQSVKEILINSRKMDFQKEFEENLYLDAVKSGKVTFFEE